METIRLVVGDWSGDGHEKTQTIYIESNLSTDQLTKAYKNGCKVIGFKLIDYIADDYLDDAIGEDEINKLQTTGFDISKIKTEPDFNGRTASLYVQNYVDIYLHIVKLGNPKFKFEIVNPPYLNIGGYGLFE